jgi:preprotein translocase subunit SecE
MVDMKNIYSWLVIVIITLVALSTSYFLNMSTPIKVTVWLIWLALVVGFGYMTTSGKQLFEFFKEAKIELLKVVWPTRQETIQTTTIVMVMVAITGFVLWGIDSGMMWMVGKVTHLG